MLQTVKWAHFAQLNSVWAVIAVLLMWPQGGVGLQSDYHSLQFCTRLNRLCNSFYTGVMCVPFYVSVWLIRRTIHYITLIWQMLFDESNSQYGHSHLIGAWVYIKTWKCIPLKQPSKNMFCDMWYYVGGTRVLLEFCLLLCYKSLRGLLFIVSSETYILLIWFWVIITQKTQIPMCA